jgi:hypothetical protein
MALVRAESGSQVLAHRAPGRQERHARLAPRHAERAAGGAGGGPLELVLGDQLALGLRQGRDRGGEGVV